MTTQNTGTTNRKKKPYIYLSFESDSVCLTGSAPFGPIFPAQNVCNFFFMVGKNSTVYGDRMYLSHSLVTVA